MENHGILNWRKWPPTVRKAAKLGVFAGALITVCGYALNHWFRSIAPGGGDALAFFVELPSLLPLFALIQAARVLGFRIETQWGAGEYVWAQYLLAGLLNTILLAVAFGFIRYGFHTLRKRKG